MNLVKIKELEDFKKELSGLQRQINSNFERSKAEFFKNGIEEFKDFFIKQGFDIKEDNIIDSNGHKNKVIIANYNNFKVDIAIPPIDISYMGAISTWELNVSKNKTKYLLIINDFEDKNYAKSSTIIHARELTEDEKIEKEIEETKERIIELKKELESDEKIILGFTLVKEENKKTGKSYQEYSIKFTSMINLLNHLFS